MSGASIRRTASLAATVLCLAACGGHTIHRAYVPNHGSDFNFKTPPCAPSPRPESRDGDVALRFLGVGGVYLEWNGIGLLTAPFFSNYGALEVGFGAVGWDEAAIERGLAGTPLDRVRIVLVGHAHYDHFADLPPILDRLPPDARVYVNRSGLRMLSAFERHRSRWVELDELENQWLRPVDKHGNPMPFRILPIPSTHAAHIGKVRFAKGEVPDAWETWDGKRLRKMREGKPFAFVVDFLDDDGATAFRIYYQDAAGIPAPLRDDREIDVAILCMPSHWHLEGYPEIPLENARHVLIIHYEDFLRPRDKPLRFSPFLTDKRANRFMELAERAISENDLDPSGPDPCTCGPCGEAWTLPLPGDLPV